MPRRLPRLSDFPVTRDQEGRKLCRMCQKPIPRGRRTLCSEECVEQLLLAVNPAHLRKRIQERDRGVCARCGADTEKIGRVLDHVRRSLSEHLGVKRGWANLWWFQHQATGLLERLAWQYGRVNWEIDHIIEVNDGGAHVMANLQTLCIPCHKVKTTEYARIRAVRERVRRMRRDG
jgi:5-methylcytosine-specific restriction protein A